MFLKPIKYKKEYDLLISRYITEWLYASLFKDLFKIIKISNKIYNAQTNALQEAIIKGLVYYQNGAFYSKHNKFSNAVALELEKMGAKYSKYRKAYVLSADKISNSILWAIDTEKARTQTTVKAIVEFLALKEGQLPQLSKELVFDTFVNQIMLDLQDRVYKNALNHKLELITPKLDDFRMNEIAKRYTENLDFWIKNFTETEIPKMRNEILTMVLDGKTTHTIADYIQIRYNINRRKALFLARNESAIATTSYLKAKYQSEGIEYFKWHANIDGRERPLHGNQGETTKDGTVLKGLNGQIFRFDNPPIIDARTGQRGLPAETYNCRCVIAPYIDKDFINRRRELYKKYKGNKEKWITKA